MFQCEQVINHITDNDLYAFTMSNAGMRYQDIVTEDILIIRKEFKIDDEWLAEFIRQVHLMKDLYLTDVEEAGLNTFYYLPKTYISWFKNYRFDPSELEIWSEDNLLKIKIKGLFYRTVFWETPLMALASELFFKWKGYKPDAKYIERAEAKGRRMLELGARYSEFGTRRRFSFDVQINVLKALIRTSGLLKDGGVLVGTSNVYMAIMLGITATGTNAHKWYQLHAGLYGVRMANFMALRAWEETYGTYLGTALTDTYTSKEFAATLSRHDALLYESFRQDSGDPIEYVKLFLKTLKDLRIHPSTKTILFSDSLNLELVEKIVKYCKRKINCTFGIGTFLSNDILGVEPLKIVIKQVAVYLSNGRRVATCKLSDDAGKASGEPEAISHALYEIGYVG